MIKISIAELFCIWKTQPCEAGDTLSGGETVACLRREGLIHPTEKGYVVTQKGEQVIQKIISEIDKAQVFIGVSVKINGL